MALVSYGSSGEESNDDEEDLVVSNESTTTANSILKDRVEPEFKMRVPKSAKLPNLVPNIPIVKTKDGKVLLSVPDLEALDSSDDSDDESSRSAKNKSYRNSKPGTDKVSLLSVLPPTRALIVREGNRPMIPHQLICKKNTSHTVKETLTMKTKPENVGQKPGFQNNNDDDDVWDADITSKQDSDKDTLEIADEDAEEVSFFSFYKPTPNNHEAVASERAAALSALQATRKKAELSSKPLTVDNDDSNSFITVKLSHDENSTTSRLTAKSWEECLPKVTISDPEILRQMSSVKKEIADQEEDDKEDVEEKVFWTEENFVPGPERKRARLVMPGTKSNNIAVNELLQSTNTEVISINQSDLTAGAQLELIKSVTSDDSQYRPKSTDDDPGKLAHRKHQITWLAHQAQENEMELEKRWAEARRNKASNRAKYGF
ncbi:unnamed protein product [Schistosoma intercalatum]|nr:unnamed protein product [Schistosoma intercalatum]CAH8605590.1 unnamed protein product [Schistosoma intercalatum]